MDRTAESAAPVGPAVRFRDDNPRTWPGPAPPLWPGGPEPGRDGRRAGRRSRPPVPPGLRRRTPCRAVRRRQAPGTRGDRDRHRTSCIAGPYMSGFDVRLVRHGLPGALGEPDQLLRLARFRVAHPEVIIGDGGSAPCRPASPNRTARP